MDHPPYRKPQAYFWIPSKRITLESIQREKNKIKGMDELQFLGAEKKRKKKQTWKYDHLSLCSIIALPAHMQEQKWDQLRNSSSPLGTETLSLENSFQQLWQIIFQERVFAINLCSFFNKPAGEHNARLLNCLRRAELVMMGVQDYTRPHHRHL